MGGCDGCSMWVFCQRVGGLYGCFFFWASRRGSGLGREEGGGIGTAWRDWLEGLKLKRLYIALFHHSSFLSCFLFLFGAFLGLPPPPLLLLPPPSLTTATTTTTATATATATNRDSPSRRLPRNRNRIATAVLLYRPRLQRHDDGKYKKNPGL